MSRALPQQGYTGQQNLGDVGTQAYHVEPGLRTAKSRKSASSGGQKTQMHKHDARRSRKTAKSDEEVKSAKTKVVWDLDMEEIKTSFAYGQSRAEGRGPRNTFEIECDVDLEDPVALEPSWDEEQQRRQPSDKRPWSPSSSLSRPSRQRSGTLLDGPEPERRSERPERDHPECSFVPPVGDPFRPDFFPDDRRMWWLPDGGLLGPRHPAWGQVMPGRSGGMMPRFDPIGPGEPDPDHLPLPGRGGPGGVVFGFDASMRKIMGDGEAGEVAKGVTSNRHLQVLCTWAKSRKIANLR
eukprot:g10024.t1